MIMQHFKLKEFLNIVKLAEEGDAESQNILGARLVTDTLINSDILGSCYWYCEAIKQGYIHAKWNFGSMLIDGDDGIQKNEEIGLRLIKEAAQGGDNSACLFLASCYKKGKYGIEIDEELADFWEKKAWSQDNMLEFNQPIDIEIEYGIKFQKPDLVLKNNKST